VECAVAGIRGLERPTRSGKCQGCFLVGRQVLSPFQASGSCLPGIGYFNIQNHQPDLHLVGTSVKRAGNGGSSEPRRESVDPPAPDDGSPHPRGLARAATAGPIIRQLGDRLLRGIPVARGVLIQIGRRLRQVRQGVAKHRRGFVGQNAAQLHTSIFLSTVVHLAEATVSQQVQVEPDLQFSFCPRGPQQNFGFQVPDRKHFVRRAGGVVGELGGRVDHR